jgi:hypothetical protein
MTSVTSGIEEVEKEDYSFASGKRVHSPDGITSERVIE